MSTTATTSGRSVTIIVRMRMKTCQMLARGSAIQVRKPKPVRLKVRPSSLRAGLKMIKSRRCSIITVDDGGGMPNVTVNSTTTTFRR